MPVAQPTPALLRVRVVDRFAMVQAWGHGASGGAVLADVEIAGSCPSCCGLRGLPMRRRFCEDGEFYDADTWTNPCGHVDRYSAVPVEGGRHNGHETVTNSWAGPGWVGRKQREI